MSPWERAVAGQLSGGGKVNLTEVGDVAGIPDEAVTSPLFPDVAEAIVAAFTTLDEEDKKKAVHLLCTATSTTTSGLALRMLCDVVVPAADALGATDTLKNVLHHRVNERSDEASSTIAAIALKALCHLALLEPTARFMLFDALGTIGTQDESEVFATAASWVAGAAFDRWREQTAADCLERLTSGDGEAEASFWLAQTLLVSALTLHDIDDVRTALRGTLEHFDRAAAMGEDRPDAVLYATTVRFITDYVAGTDAGRLSEHLSTATAAFRHYLIDGVGLPDVPSWMRPRYDAEVRWVELLDRLHAATTSEDRSAWFQAPQMIDRLADAYTAAHTLTPTRSYLHPGSGPTAMVETLIPRLASPFIDDIVPLAYLDQWLEHTDHPDATDVRDAIAERVAKGVDRGKVRPPASSRRSPSISETSRAATPISSPVSSTSWKI